MKIGFIQYNLSIQLNKETARSSGDFVYNLGLFKMLLSDPINTITIYTSFDVKSEKVWNNIDNYPELLFMKGRVEYKPNQRFIDNDTDFIYINGSCTNLMYGDRAWGISSIAKCYKLLQTYKGLVLINPGEVEIEFVFFLEGFHSMLLLDHKVTSMDLLKDKRYIILTKAYNTDKFVQMCSSYRNVYDKLGMDIKYHADSALPNLLLSQQTPVEIPDYYCTYIGNKRLACSSYRMDLVKFYLCRIPGSHIWGDWEQPDVDGTSITIHGKAAYGDVVKILNKSRYSLVFTDHQYEKDNLRILTNRIFEIIKSGCIPLVYTKADPRHVIPDFPPYLIFDSPQHAEQMMKDMDEKGYEYRCKLSAYLNKCISHFDNPKLMLDDLIRIIEGVKLNPVPDYMHAMYFKVILPFMNPQAINNYSDAQRILGLNEQFLMCNPDLTGRDDFDKSKLQYSVEKICKQCSNILQPVSGMGQSRLCTTCGGKAVPVGRKMFNLPVHTLKCQVEVTINETKHVRPVVLEIPK
jgi:hypothetical protein